MLAGWFTGSASTATKRSWPPRDDDLEELVGYVAAEANHEPNRRRKRQLDAALDALSDSGR